MCYYKLVKLDVYHVFILLSVHTMWACFVRQPNIHVYCQFATSVSHRKKKDSDRRKRFQENNNSVWLIIGILHILLQSSYKLMWPLMWYYHAS